MSTPARARPGPGLGGGERLPGGAPRAASTCAQLGARPRRAGSTSGAGRRKARVPGRGARADPNGEAAAGGPPGGGRGWRVGGASALRVDRPFLYSSGMDNVETGATATQDGSHHGLGSKSPLQFSTVGRTGRRPERSRSWHS
ncbi:translation initiation factor IF-2-like isoform X3 [Leopardus geoffroyi]|uniref:translation initiation factor IF-2-like isoform X3 n=1 Tax=Leopardus geoffroyi TaxID=46844 RepID=UPI001E25E5B3|nr:translation initiation factor IF-2-like isoform X3 [Leopardus geoffroyi]